MSLAQLVALVYFAPLAVYFGVAAWRAICAARKEEEKGGVDRWV